MVQICADMNKWMVHRRVNKEDFLYVNVFLVKKIILQRFPELGSVTFIFFAGEENKVEDIL